MKHERGIEKQSFIFYRLVSDVRPEAEQIELGCFIGKPILSS